MQIRARRHWVLNKQLNKLDFYEDLGEELQCRNCSVVLFLLFSQFLISFVCWYYTVRVKDKEAWRAAVRGVAKCGTGVSN